MGNKHVNKRMLHRVFVATLAFASITAVAIDGQALAAPNTTTNSASTIKISPVRTDISTAPGKTTTVTMKVSNISKSSMTIRPIENDFVAGDEKGTPALILDADKFAPTHSLKRYMAPLQDITVPAGKTQDVKLTVNVPADAKAGGYYGAVRFVPVTPEGTANVNLNASAASLVLLTVPGDLSEQLKLTNATVKQGESTVGGILQNPDNLHVQFRFENQGNVQVAPFGQVYVKQGDKVIYTSNFNQEQPRGMVLPDSARRWDIPLDKLGKFGKYTIGATFTYGTGNKSIDFSKTIWIIPLSYVIGAVVGIIVLIILIVGIWLGLRSYKRRVIKGSGGGGYRR